MTSEQEIEEQKGTCMVCGLPAPDSIICDPCFVERWLKPTVEALTKPQKGDSAT
jgi:hypothetical protein